MQIYDENPGNSFQKRHLALIPFIILGIILILTSCNSKVVDFEGATIKNSFSHYWIEKKSLNSDGVSYIDSTYCPAKIFVITKSNQYVEIVLEPYEEKSFKLNSPFDLSKTKYYILRKDEFYKRLSDASLSNSYRELKEFYRRM